jgi:AraC family transcriptional regulator, regulatory protein of adaptative response / methylated-DNA-[protein]-cysteine methyltransferase
MTFVEYARSRGMGIAMKQIRDAQLNMGYELASGFRDTFSKILGAAPTDFKGQHKILKTAWIDSPLGPMLIISDEDGLFLLEFVERRGLEKEIERLRNKLKAVIIPGDTPHIDSIEKELTEYFSGNLQKFKTSIHLLGSVFQKTVWQELMRIPYGETKSYLQQSQAIGKPKSYRAVANSNGANQLAIIIPCHRVIKSNGDLGGYGGGLHRKKWLLEHEKNKNYCV